METTVLAVLGQNISLSADYIHYKCYSQDIMQDLNFRPTAQHKLNFFRKLEPFCISSITLVKHLCLPLYPAPFLWFYSTPTFAACLRFLHGEGAAAPQMLC